MVKNTICFLLCDLVHPKMELGVGTTNLRYTEKQSGTINFRLREYLILSIPRAMAFQKFPLTTVKEKHIMHFWTLVRVPTEERLVMLIKPKKYTKS